VGLPPLPCIDLTCAERGQAHLPYLLFFFISHNISNRSIYHASPITLSRITYHASRIRPHSSMTMSSILCSECKRA